MSKSNTKRANGQGSIYQRKSDKIWCASMVVGYDEQGEPDRKTLCGKSYPEAVANLERLRAMAASAEWSDADKITLGEWMADWLETTAKPRVTQATYDSYKSMIETHITPALGAALLQKLQPLHVRRLLAGMSASYSARTCQYAHTVLNMALKQAVIDGLVKVNPCGAVKRPVPKRKAVCVLNKRQVAQLFKRIEKSAWRAHIWLSWGTGMRREEVLGLTWKDVDFARRTVTVRQALVVTSEGLELTEPKSKASYRTLTVPPEVMKQLKMHKAQQAQIRLAAGLTWQHNDLAFPRNDGTPQDPRQYTRAFDRFAKQLKFPKGTSLHALRHTHATNLLQAGVPVKAVQYRLGHATAAMTLDVYGHFVPNIQDGIAEKLSKMLKPQKKIKKWASSRCRVKRPVATAVATVDRLTVNAKP